MFNYGDNRRRHRRVKINITFRLSKTSSELVSIEAYTRDLSIGGACIEINQQLSPYTIVRLYFQTIKKEVFDVEGRILWIKELRNESPEDDTYETEKQEEPCRYLAGVQFLNLHTEERKKQIHELMNKRAS